MEAQNVLYKVQVVSFHERILRISFRYLVMPFFLLVPLLSIKGDNTIRLIALLIIFSIVVGMIISCYKWTFSQLTLVTFDGDFFRLEAMFKNRKQVFTVPRTNLKTTLKWEGGRPAILKLVLFDGLRELACFYSAGVTRMEYALEGIAYKINDLQAADTMKV